MKEHLRNKIAPFLDHELPEEERQEVGEHLIHCRECRELHDEIRQGREFASMLKSEDAPASVWQHVAAGTDRPSYQRSPFLKPLLAFGAAVVAMLLFVPVYLYVRPPSEDTSPVAKGDLTVWKVEDVKGNPKITQNGNGMELAVGEVLETDAASSATIAVADIGKVDVAPNSRVRLVKTGAKEHRLALDRGKLSAEITAPPRLFIVDTPTAAAVDLGCAYTLEVDANGDSRLKVTGGYVSLETERRESFVPAGAFCETRQKRLGTPYFESASQLFKTSLAKFDFENGGEDAISVVIRESGRKDTLTLWHLLSKVPEAARAEVLAKILQDIELPEGVTIDGILKLDPKMMGELRSDLEPLWYEQPGWFDD